jgi:outer membrane protein OmpA-like peptidoglycan-associated protein
MKMKVFRFCFSLALGIISSYSAFCQDDFELANKLYDKFAYSKAIPLYEKIISKENKHSKDARIKAADCYRRINDYKSAEQLYEKITADTTCSIEQHLLFAQVLMSERKNEKARAHMKIYLEKNPGDPRAKSAITSLDSMSNFFSKESSYEIKRLNINSANSDMCPAVYNDGIVFSSARPDAKNKDQDFTGKPYLKLYYAKGKEMHFDEPVSIFPELQTHFNDGPVCYSVTTDELFITRNNIVNGKIKMDNNRVVRLKIYWCNNENGKWSALKNFPYNSETYSCAHPCLSTDGKKLYFSSDMPGGFGGMDIWVCSRTDSTWSQPVNLGNEINSRGNEVFPFVDSEGRLMYSSNGMGGIGGLDVFVATADGDKFSAPKNMGAPINSSYDDFGIIYDKKNRCGYFSSNRESKNDNDDLYMYKKTCVPLNGLVFDKETGDPIAMADVKIVESGTEKETVKSDEKGKFKSCLVIGKDYDFIATKEEYSKATVSLKDVGDDAQEVKIPMTKTPLYAIEGRVYLEEDKSSIIGISVFCENLKTKEKRECKSDANGMYHFGLDANTDYRITCTRERCADNNFVKSTVGLKKSTTIRADIGFYCEGDIIKIDNIYYDLAKWNIRADAAKELDKLVDILKKYPNMKIELGSHTDCRASAKYNQDLSEKRAKSAVQYVASKGIDNSRMTYKGYGESKPVNKCECEGAKVVPCTEEEHQQNRRTEFKIISIK